MNEFPRVPPREVVNPAGALPAQFSRAVFRPEGKEFGKSEKESVFVRDGATPDMLKNLTLLIGESNFRFAPGILSSFAAPPHHRGGT